MVILGGKQTCLFRDGRVALQEDDTMTDPVEGNGTSEASEAAADDQKVDCEGGLFLSTLYRLWTVVRRGEGGGGDAYHGEEEVRRARWTRRRLSCCLTIKAISDHGWEMSRHVSSWQQTCRGPRSRVDIQNTSAEKRASCRV